MSGEEALRGVLRDGVRGVGVGLEGALVAPLDAGRVHQRRRGQLRIEQLRMLRLRRLNEHVRVVQSVRVRVRLRLHREVVLREQRQLAVRVRLQQPVGDHLAELLAEVRGLRGVHRRPLHEIELLLDGGRRLGHRRSRRRSRGHGRLRLPRPLMVAHRRHQVRLGALHVRHRRQQRIVREQVRRLLALLVHILAGGGRCGRRLLARYQVLLSNILSLLLRKQCIRVLRRRRWNR